MLDSRRAPAITIVGLGYVGLCTAVAFASRGFKVYGSDTDQSRVATIDSGRPPFFEPDLQDSLRATIHRTLSVSNLIRPEALCFLTVGTPGRKDGSVDLRQIESASHDVGKALRKHKGYVVVVIKSTVPPGTAEKVILPILESESGRRAGVDVGLAVNPEFLREGTAIEDSLRPGSLIIGEFDRKSGDFLQKFYLSFYGSALPQILRTRIINAEIMKYASNAYLATKVSFINMVANLCEGLPGADVEVVANALGLDKRIGAQYLKAGAGWGGSCWPKDLRAFKKVLEDRGVEPALVSATISLNDQQPRRLVRRAEKMVGLLKQRKVAILGLAFKPGTDDIRNAVSLRVITELLSKRVNVVAYDPMAVPCMKKALKPGRRNGGGSLAYSTSALGAIKGADCCIVVTEWEEFRELTPAIFVQNMRKPVIIDGRRIYDPAEFTRTTSFAAVGLGRS